MQSVPITSPTSTLSATVERTPEALARHVEAWDVLVEHACEPNPFYEPQALLSAWRHLAPAELFVVLVWAQHPLPGQRPYLAGLFPLVREQRYKSMPLPTLATWKHLYAYLGTPLVRDDLADLTLDAFFAWLRSSSDAALFEWRGIGSDGAFRHSLIETLNRLGYDRFSASVHTRAYFQPGANADAYIDDALPGKKRKELRRQERRLAELGAVTYDEASDLDAWLDEYLALEQRGWKGRGGTALGDDPAGLRVFREIAHAAHARGRWMTLALRVDGKAIAMKCNLRGGPGAIAFKIAYDEAYARFSPGVLLELEHLRRLHITGAPAWMDSGAASDHPMIGHLWRDRVAIETLVVPTGRGAGELAVAALPLIRWTSRTLRGALQRLRKP